MRRRARLPAALVPGAALALVLGTLLAACGPTTPTPAPTGSSAATATPSGTPAGPATVRAYFGLGSTTGNPILAPVERTGAAATADATDPRRALEFLLAGPTDAELGASPALFTTIPADTTLQGLQVDDAGVATADFSAAFAETEDLPGLRTAMAQVVVTLTQFAEVTGVNITIDGAVLEQTDASGQQLGGPATRADYGDQLGPIFVDAPAWGATLHSPFELSGLANVFEAQFRFRLLDADGRSLADGQLTASCGTGCLGSFGVSVPYNVAAPTTGHLQVFDLSEADGSMADLVDYPVALLP